jgi:hypothetical protein
MVPYVRAKAESFGVPMKDGLMQRPERVLTLGLAVILSPWVDTLRSATSGHPPQRLVAICLVLLAITSNTTAVGRIMRLLGALRRQGSPESTTAASAGTPGPQRPTTAPRRLVRT